MALRDELQDWVLEALREHHGAATIVEVAKYIAEHYMDELRRSGDLLYTWQYDMRWACTKLRQRKLVMAAEVSERGVWKLA